MWFWVGLWTMSEIEVDKLRLDIWVEGLIWLKLIWLDCEWIYFGKSVGFV